MNKIYLPGLNGIRAIAALIVVISHITQLFKAHLNFSFPVYLGGGLAVTLFFVLSGYLITYLLILEKEKFNTIDLKAFYLRRILRIWPLYYIMIIASICVMFFLYQQNLLSKNQNNLNAVVLFVFFAGNIAESIYQLAFTPIGVLWSVAVEEQFYLFWPLLLKFCKPGINVFFTFLLAFSILKIIIRVFLSNTFLSSLISLTRLDCMAIGALGACFVLDAKLFNKYVRRYVFSKQVQVLSWAIAIIGFATLKMPLSIFSDDFYALFFVIIIINISQNKNTLINLETKILNFLGRISYGIYMYHVLVIFVFQKIVYFPADNIFYYFSNLSIILILTIIVAYISNKYIENYFLRKKMVLARIKSSNGE
ncbi:acyltransferase [Ferruginibacter paludis]|uniref:acyltransferase family protein n=1 Tax=Ferruginibacter paludis TaxID=1310417 RepID=UPI0025B50AFE|nr:acyltransferase [Ferruginibacter paludis]MDN3658334.1 acyltransferase [Ferruginibacter paludis]